MTGEVCTPIGVARAVHADMARTVDAVIPGRPDFERRVFRALARGGLNPERIPEVVVNRAMQAVLASSTEAHDRTAVAREVAGFRRNSSKDVVDLFHRKDRLEAQDHSRVEALETLRIHINEGLVGASGHLPASRVMCGAMAVPVVAMRWTADDHVHVDVKIDAIFHVIAESAQTRPLYGGFQHRSWTPTRAPATIGGMDRSRMARCAP